MNGNVRQKNLSKEFLTNLTIERVLEILLLVLSGALAIVLHARLRTPINVPGHHGLEFMAIIVAARLSSKIKWASSISAIGIGIFILFPVLGFSDPMAGINYMLPCLLLDVGYNSIGSMKNRKLVFSIIAGVAYMMIPLSRIIVTLSTGYPYSSFIKHGFFTPLATFFIFGLLGGALGLGLNLLGKRLVKKL